MAHCHGGLADAHRNFLRLYERLPRELFHFGGEGRGEQHRLPLFRHGFDDSFYIRQKTHVEHAVGFIQNQNFDAIHFRMSLLDEVKQTTRARHQDFHTLTQCLDLTVGSDAPIDGRAPQPCPR
jgi:hypothetical protein